MKINCNFTHKLLPHKNKIRLIMDKHHRFVAANQSTVELFGYSSIEQLLGDTPSEIPCEASQSADAFISQNNHVMKTEESVVVLDVHRYSQDNIHSLFTIKNPVYGADGSVVAVDCACNEMLDKNLAHFMSSLMSIDRFLFSDKAESFSYTNSTPLNTVSLSNREEQCLFFLIRGSTAKQIAQKLQLSPSSITSYIENMKVKLDCQTRSQLIEKAIHLGLVPLVPKSLLKFANLSIILS